MGPARYGLVDGRKSEGGRKLNETGSRKVKANERRGWYKRMAAHRALGVMRKEYKASRALVMMVKRKLDLLVNMLGLKYSP